MKYCHGCLKRIWFWESRAEGRHIKCLPIKERCKYYHIQRDISSSAFFGVMVGIAIIGSTNSIFIRYVAIGIAVCVFFVSSFLAYIIREKEEDERSRGEEKGKIKNN
jgi:phage shock protein PspC (stress-responsive transcriptional regulator)